MDDLVVRAGREAARMGHNYIGTEHALLAIVTDDPALLEAYGVTWAALVAAITTELLRVVAELRGARAIVEPVRQVAEQQTATPLPPRSRGPGHPTGTGVPSTVTPRLWTVLEHARSSDGRDVLAAILDEDSNLAVIVLDRLGVPLDELRRQLG